MKIHTPRITAWILTLALFIALINVPGVSAKVYSIGDCSVMNNVTMPNMIVGEDDGGIVLLRNLKGENTSKNWAAGGTGANNFGVVFNDTGALIAPTITAVTCQEYGNNTDLLIHVFTNAAEQTTLTRYFYNTGLIKTTVTSTKHNYSFRDFGPNGDGFGDLNASALIFNSTEIMTAQTSLTDADDKHGVIGRTYNLTTNYTWVTSWNQVATKTDFDHQSRSTGTALGSAIGRSDGLLNTTTLIVYQTFTRRNTTTQAVASWTAPALSFKWMVENKTVYLNATGGSDSNDGYTWATAKRSIAGLNDMNVSPDTTICLHSGQVFRGVHYAKNFTTLTTCAGTTPAQIWNSRSLNASGYWTSVGNGLWRSNETFASSLVDVGNVIFSETAFPNSLVKVHYTTPPAQINDSSFYYNTSTNRNIYIKSATNPGTRWSFLEAMWDQNIIKAEGISNWRVYNVTLKYSGAHGIGIVNAFNILLEDLVVEYNGGAYHGTFPARYGNSVEVALDQSNVTIKNNLIRYCFDAGITSQSWASAGNTTARNINITGNVVTDCAYGFEGFASISTGGSIVTNLSVMYNTFVDLTNSWHGNDRQNIAYHTMTRQSAYPSGSRNIRFLRNIGQNSKDLTVYASGTGTTYFDNVDILFDYNVYFANRTSNTAGFAKYLNTVYSTQSAYVAATGNDTHSLSGANYFINQAADDFRLYNFSAACALGAGAEPCVNITNKLSVAINVSKNNTVIGTNITPSYDFIFTDDVQLTANCTFVFDNQPRAEVRGLNSSQSYSFPINFTIGNGFYEVYVNCTNTQGLTNQSTILIAEVESPTQKVTNLAQTSKTLTTIGLSWVNPESDTFNYNMVIVDGDTENATITTGETTTLTGLTQGTTYSIVVRSYDTTGSYGTATLTATTRAYAVWSGYAAEPISTLLNTYDPRSAWRDNAYAYDENYATAAYIDSPSLDIGWGASLNVTSAPSRYASNENRSAALIQVKMEGSFTNSSACFQSDGSANLVYHTFRPATNTWNNYAMCINTTRNDSIVTTSGVGNAKYYESSLYRYYTTSYELTVTGVYTLNGTIVPGNVTICNLNTSNCTYGTTPLYVPMLNGTQTLSFTSDGYYEYTTDVTIRNNATRSFTGLANTQITFTNPTTGLPSNRPVCAFDIDFTNNISNNGEYYHLADGSYTIHCKNILEVTNYSVTKEEGETLLLNLSMADPLISISQTCGEANTAMYVSLVDEQNLTSMAGNIYNYRFVFGLIGQTYAYYGTFNSTNNFSLCIDADTFPNWTLEEGEIFYSADGYEDRRYYVFGGTRLTENQLNLTLYNLLSSESTTFLLNVESTTLSSYADKYVTLVRWYPNYNSYLVTEMGKTDGDGSAIVHVELEDVDYRIGVYEQNGTLIYLSSPKQFVCLTTPCTYTLKVKPEDVDYTSTLKIQGGFNYDDENGIWRYEFSDPSQTTSTYNLTVYKMSGSSSYPVCTSTVTAYAGAVLCNTSAYSGHLRAEIKRAGVLLDQLVDTANLPSPFKSSFGLFLSFLIAVPIMCVLVVVSPIAGLIAGILALVPAWYFGSIGFAVFAGVIVMAGISIHFVKRAKEAN